MQQPSIYEDYWQLSKKPFAPAVHSDDLYASQSHEGAILKLRYAIESRNGAAILAGPAGVGKTMLLNMLRQEFESETTQWVHVVFPQMSSQELLVYIAEQLNAPLDGPPRYTTEESIRRLEKLFAENQQQGRHVVVAIDEAHVLEDWNALETLRLLLNFEVDSQPAITLLLVGQSGVLSTVNRSQTLDQRVTVKALLRPFSLEETTAFVRRQMTLAGSVREVFSPSAFEAIHYLAHGIPREINRLCDLSLLVGYADGLHTIEAEHVESVCQELVSVISE